ncbi:MAG TPA: DUF2339 domain-containing protein [Acidobacteriaceae bacterium]|nr:DUF2339 domain-containing protein [Acidobacteriaceae bacterium]
MDPSLSGGLPEQLAELRARVRRLEETFLSRGIALPDFSPEAVHAPAHSAAAAQAPVPESAPHQAVAAPIPAPRFAAFETAAAAHDSHSLENRIGSHWFNRIGILAVLIGMAWFLKLAIDNHWIGPLGRILIGLIAGAAIIAWSERFDRRGYRGFGYSLKAVGSGILYLSLWAAFSLFHLIPAPVAFAAMIAVTAFNGFLAWIRDAELLAVYAIAGGLSTPLLLSTGANNEISLFCYLFLLDLAVLALVALRPWSRLLFGAFTGTVLFFAGWWLEYYSAAQSERTAFFLACFFLIFAFAPRLIRLGNTEIDPSLAFHSRWDGLALVALPLLNAGLGFLGFYGILDSTNSTWAGPWIAVAFAAFYLLLLRLPSRGVWRGSPTVLSSLHLTAAVVFLTIAIPLEAHGRWLTIGWLSEGALLLWLAARVRLRLLSILALLGLALGLGSLILVNPPASITPFFNQRFGTYCAGIAAFSFAAWIAAQQPGREDEHAVLSWHGFALASVLIVNALILIAAGWEIHNYWWYLAWRGDWRQLHDYRIYAQFTYSAFFMIFGAILLAFGFWRRSPFLRWQALLLLAITIGKVFLVDVSQLSQGYRILSFLGLGALLLAVSFLYQRDWLNLRGSEEKTL